MKCLDHESDHDHEELKMRGATSGLLTNIGLFVAKLIVGLATGTLSVTAEAAHSAVDILSSLNSMVGIKYKWERLARYFETFLLFSTASGILYGVMRSPSHVVDPLPGIVIMVIGTIFNFTTMKHNHDVAHHTQSLALHASATHSLTDVLASLITLVGLVVMYFTHFYVLDKIIGAIIALMIGVFAVKLLFHEF